MKIYVRDLRLAIMGIWVCFASCKINPKNSVCHKAYIKDINEYIYLHPEVETTYKYGYDSLYRHVLQRLNQSSIEMDRYKSLRASFVVQAIISKKGYPVFFSIVKTGSKDAKKTELKSLSTNETGEVEKVVINSLYELKDWTPARCKNNQVTSRVLIPFRLNLQ